MSIENKDLVEHTVITNESITLRDDDNSELLLGFDSDFKMSVECYQWDKDADLFYIGLKKNAGNEDEIEEVGIGLTVDQLKNLINTAQRLIRKLEKGE